MKNKTEILKILINVKEYMQLRNIEYSQAYLDLTKAIKLLDGEEENKPIRKIAIGER